MHLKFYLISLCIFTFTACSDSSGNKSYYGEGIFMWESKYEKIYKDVKKESIWLAWSDVNSWPTWDLDTEFTSISGPFEAGTQFVLKPKGGPKVSIQLTEVKPMTGFTDVTKFPFARMYDTHEMEETPEGLKIRSIIRVEGPLSWLWRKIVAEDVATGAPKQIDALVKFVGSGLK